MQSKAAFGGVIAVIFLFFALAGSAEAKKGNGKGGGTEKVELEAELEPCCNTPESEAEGDSERKSKTKDGVSKEERFKAEVEIPIPNALGIDESNAQSADIRLILSRAGTNYAECQLVFDEIEDDDGEIEVNTSWTSESRRMENRSRGGAATLDYRMLKPETWPPPFWL